MPCPLPTRDARPRHPLPPGRAPDPSPAATERDDVGGRDRARVAAAVARAALALALALIPALPVGPEARRAVRAAPPADPSPDAPAEVAYLAGALVDYAPSGMPDFSQCRPGWDRPSPAPGRPGQWTHAAPVALADALWWLDSRAEPNPRAPELVNDGHPLVTAYPAFGPRRDDHALDNLPPLVADLAGRVNTDGRRRPGAVRGSAWEDVVEGAEAYVAARAGASYEVIAAEAPSGEWLAAQAARGAGVVVALGVWEQGAGADQGAPAWTRVGGHYAAVAGADAAGTVLALADPLADHAAEGGAGRTAPAGSSAHSCRNAPRAHDDAAVVAHDAYALFPPAGLPGDRVALGGYFTPASFGEGAAFADLNPMGALAAHAGPWRGGVLVMALDAALAVVPRGVLGPPTARPSATASPAASATGTPAPATASPAPTDPPAAEPTARPSPSATATASARAAARPGRRAWLPFAGVGGLPRRPLVSPRDG